jgi:hypothetical protein
MDHDGIAAATSRALGIPVRYEPISIEEVADRLASLGRNCARAFSVADASRGATTAAAAATVNRAGHTQSGRRFLLTLMPASLEATRAWCLTDCFAENHR